MSYVVIVYRGGSGPRSDEIMGVHGPFTRSQSASDWLSRNLRGQKDYSIRMLYPS